MKQPFFLILVLTCQLVFTQDSGLIFQDVSFQAGISANHRAVWHPQEGTGYLSVGQAWADYNNDGWLDLYVTGNQDPNTLFVNNGDGSFSLSPFNEQVKLLKAKSGGAIWADYDNDGWRDLYVLNDGANVLFRNEAGQGFRNVSREAGVADTGKGSSASWGDFDKDGYLDLYVVNWSCLPECQPENLQLNQDKLYKNKGDGTFLDASKWLERSRLTGAGFAASFFDADNDGDSDLYVVNDKMTNPIGNVLWRNDGAGCGGWCFVDISREAGVDTRMHAMGLAVGDYNNDLQLDLYATNMLSQMYLSKNLGDGQFDDVSGEAGVLIVDTDRSAVGWGTGFLDIDNDGFLDLYIATTGTKPGPPGFYGGRAPNMEDFHYPYPELLYKNLGDGRFEALPRSSLSNPATVSMGFAYADYNKDGQLDFVQGNWNEGYVLYKNESNTKNNWLNVRLTGAADINRDAVGARVFIEQSNGHKQMQEVINGQSLGAGHDLALHFGLGSTTISNLSIIWPNGKSQSFKDITVNQHLELSYKEPQ